MTDPIVKPPVRVEDVKIGTPRFVTDVQARSPQFLPDVLVEAPVTAIGRVDALGTRWWTGNGLPGAVSLPGSKPGDMYLDNTTGKYYRLTPEYFEGN